MRPKPRIFISLRLLMGAASARGKRSSSTFSPYRATRSDVRNLVGAEAFVEVFVDTPLAECERRDTKGMYASARRGEIKNFTGLDAPYEPPIHPEIRLETIGKSAADNARQILGYLLERGFIRATPLERSTAPITNLE